MTQRRAWLLAPLLVAHAALLVLALPASAPVPPSRLAAMTMTQIPMPVLAVAAWTPSEIVIPAEASAPAINIAPAPATGTTCAVGDSVQLALRDSVAVEAALDRVPAAARSIADAVMLWDGRWADASRLGGETALRPIRDTVRNSIRAASATCRSAAVAGPRLVYVEVGGRTMILAFGSGEWAWDQLLV